MPWNQESPADPLWQAIIPRGERACPALGCAAAPIQQNAVCQELLSGWLWGRYAAQRGASPLTTGSLLATTNPFVTKTLLPGPRPIKNLQAHARGTLDYQGGRAVPARLPVPSRAFVASDHPLW